MSKLLLSLLLLALAGPSSAYDLVSGGSTRVSPVNQTGLVAPVTSIRLDGSASSVTNPPGWVVTVVGPSTLAVQVPASFPVGGSGGLAVFTARNSAYFTFVTVAPPPCNLGPSKDGAPAPCDYYSAATGFHKTLAPLLLAVLFMLAVILAVWLGHDTVLKIFKSLVTGQTK